MKLRHWLPALGFAMTAPVAWAQAAQTAPDSPTDAQTVARDPVTGRLRAPTAEEAQALGKQQQSAQTTRALSARSAAPTHAASPLLRNHRGGASSVRVTEDFVSHVVVARDADGKLHQQCVASKNAADEAIDHAGHDHAEE